MGVSTDGILFYGILLDEDEVDDPYDADEIARKEFFCRVDTHCSDGDPMWFIAAEPSLRHASRGYPRDVIEVFHAMERGEQATWRMNLEALCQRLGVPFREPHLYLASWWG